MSGNIKDAALEKTIALPAAGESNYVWFDIGQEDWDSLDAVVEIEVPATTTLVAGKKMTFGLDAAILAPDGGPDEDYGANDIFCDQVAKPVIPGRTGNVSPAATYRFRLPLSQGNRILMVGCEAESGAGDNTAKSYTVRLLT